MRLNLPFQLTDKTVLLAGAGGGWDVFGAVPLAHELEKSCRVVLANYSSATAGYAVRLAAPEDRAEQALASALGKPVYVFGKEGAKTLRAGYEQLIQREGIDAVILVDGGVDALMRGDEEGPGTVLQDTISLLVVNGLDLSAKILACVGFGTETDEGVCHFRALENIAGLAKLGAFLGACALTKDMPGFRQYERVCRHAFEQPGIRSHIHTRIIPSVYGEFGRFEMYSDADQPLDLLSDRPPFISPLMSLYWFFDVAGVVQQNLLAQHLAGTETFADVLAAYDRVYNVVRGKLRPNRAIPL
jgi:hypothetical protein